jgi:hypothetical protein
MELAIACGYINDAQLKNQLCRPHRWFVRYASSSQSSQSDNILHISTVFADTFDIRNCRLNKLLLHCGSDIKMCLGVVWTGLR